MTKSTATSKDHKTHDDLEPTLATVKGSVSEKNQKALQPTLYDLIALARIIKQLHWNVIGPNFRPIHLHLDEIYAEVDGFVDQVAERIATIGISPNGRIQDVLANSELQPVPTGFIRDVEVLAYLSDRLKVTSQATRTRCDAIEDVDSVTADMLHAIIGNLEMHHWMIQSQRL